MSPGFEPVIRRLEQAGMIVAGLCVTAIMLIVCWDAGGRYIIGRPLPWAFDLVTNYLLVTPPGSRWRAPFGVATTSASTCCVRSSRRACRRPSTSRAACSPSCCSAGIAWGAAVHAQEAWASKEFYPGAVMWPVWLSFAPIPIGAGLLILRLVHHVGDARAAG